MSKEDQLVSALANWCVNLGMKPPSYPKPRWYQFKLKRKLAYYDRHNWPYTLENS